IVGCGRSIAGLTGELRGAGGVAEAQVRRRQGDVEGGDLALGLGRLEEGECRTASPECGLVVAGLGVAAGEGKEEDRTAPIVHVIANRAPLLKQVERALIVAVP